MSISASPSVSVQAIGPASQPDNLPVHLALRFFNAFEANTQKNKSGTNSREKNKGNVSQLTAQSTDGDATDKIENSEIFLLLGTYDFKDFFKLSLSEENKKLSAAIKKNRKERGVNFLIPLSDEHGTHDKFINQAKNQYLNTGWLMKNKPGMSFDRLL